LHSVIIIAALQKAARQKPPLFFNI